MRQSSLHTQFGSPLRSPLPQLTCVSFLVLLPLGSHHLPIFFGPLLLNDYHEKIRFVWARLVGSSNQRQAGYLPVRDSEIARIHKSAGQQKRYLRYFRKEFQSCPSSSAANSDLPLRGGKKTKTFAKAAALATRSWAPDGLGLPCSKQFLSGRAWKLGLDC